MASVLALLERAARMGWCVIGDGGWAADAVAPTLPSLAARGRGRCGEVVREYERRTSCPASASGGADESDRSTSCPARAPREMGGVEGVLVGLELAGGVVP